MSLTDKFLDYIMPHAKAQPFCIDEVANDIGEKPTQFQDDVRKSLNIPSTARLEDVDRLFLSAVKEKIAGEVGSEEADKRMNIFEEQKSCK